MMPHQIQGLLPLRIANVCKHYLYSASSSPDSENQQFRGEV